MTVNSRESILSDSNGEDESTIRSDGEIAENAESDASEATDIAEPHQLSTDETKVALEASSSEKLAKPGGDLSDEDFILPTGSVSTVPEIAPSWLEDRSTTEDSYQEGPIDDELQEIADEEYIEGSLAEEQLEEDEEWANAADRIIHSDEHSVQAIQQEVVVDWDIENLYDDQGKIRGKRSLRNNPPLLVVSNSDGQAVSFVLSKDLSGILARHFENANRAFYGIRPKEELSVREKFSEAKTGLRENMGKAIIVGGILLGLLIFGLFF